MNYKFCQHTQHRGIYGLLTDEKQFCSRLASCCRHVSKASTNQCHRLTIDEHCSNSSRWNVNYALDSLLVVPMLASTNQRHNSYGAIEQHCSNSSRWNVNSLLDSLLLVAVCPAITNQRHGVLFTNIIQINSSRWKVNSLLDSLLVVAVCPKHPRTNVTECYWRTLFKFIQMKR